MTKCKFCNAELKDNEPICAYCNMYNKHQMLENEKIIKESIPTNPEKEIQKNKEQQNTVVITCLLPASFVLTVGLFFFIGSLLPVSLGDSGIAFMFGFFGIPIGLVCSIIGLINSIREYNVNPKNKIVKNSIAMIVFGITAALVSDSSIFGILILGLEVVVYTTIENKK